jgi:phospholipase C
LTQFRTAATGKTQRSSSPTTIPTVGTITSSDPSSTSRQFADDARAAAGDCGAATAIGTQGRCGYGPRLPLLIISPYAKQNYVDHRATDQSSSILRFIEDNWNLGRIGNDSSDTKAGKLNGFFDFDDVRHAPKLILDPSTGAVISQGQY